MGVDEPHSQPGKAGKRGVHGIVGQDLAVDAVIRDGGDGADDVGGVDVLDVDVLEVALELVAHPDANVLQDGVPAGICGHIRPTGKDVLHSTPPHLLFDDIIADVWMLHSLHAERG